MPSSALLTHFDSIDLITMEEKAERKPAQEPTNKTQPFQAILMMTRLTILEEVASRPTAAS